jgi:hypothetical protein
MAAACFVRLKAAFCQPARARRFAKAAQSQAVRRKAEGPPEGQVAKTFPHLRPRPVLFF